MEHEEAGPTGDARLGSRPQARCRKVPQVVALLGLLASLWLSRRLGHSGWLLVSRASSGLVGIGSLHYRASDPAITRGE